MSETTENFPLNASINVSTTVNATVTVGSVSQQLNVPIVLNPTFTLNADGTISGTGVTGTWTQTPVPPTNTAPPVVSGTAQQGDTLTCTEGTWSGDEPMTFAFQWQRTSSGTTSIIDGATSSEYVLQAADVGSSVSCVVTATNDGGSATATSNASATVVPSPLAGLPRYGAALASGSYESQLNEITIWANAVGVDPYMLHHFSGNTVPASYAAGPFAGSAGKHGWLVDFELAKDGSQAAAFKTYLQSCKAAGLDMDITLWHAAPSKSFANPAAYSAALEYYVPVIESVGYRHVFDLNAWQAFVEHDLDWWPSVQVDAFGIEYYGQGYVGGQRLDAAAQLADQKGVPFGLTECGADPTNVTEAEGIAFFEYVYDFFAARIAAGKPFYGVVFWSDSSQPDFPITKAPASWLPLMKKITTLA